MVKTSPSNAGSVDSVPGCGAKIHMPLGQKIKTQNRSSVVTNSVKTFKCSTLKNRKDFIFWSSFRFTTKLRGSYRIFIHLHLHVHNLPHYQHHSPEWYLCYQRWTYTEPIVYHSWCCTFYGCGQCIMTCFHHYNIRVFSLF